MKRIAASWSTYVKTVGLSGLPVWSTQYIETRRAFYAGAEMLMNALADAVSQEDEMPPGDEQVMRDLSDEVMEFAELLKTGRA